jgi:hypothetical protein
MWSGCISITDAFPVSGSTLYPSCSIICCYHMLSADLSTAMYIKLHSYWNLWLLDGVVLIVDFIKVLPY